MSERIGIFAIRVCMAELLALGAFAMWHFVHHGDGLWLVLALIGPPVVALVSASLAAHPNPSEKE